MTRRVRAYPRSVNEPRRRPVDKAITSAPDNNWALLIGVLGMLYAGLGVTESAQHAFNQIWAVPWRIRPGFFPRQARALAMTLLLYAGLTARP